MKKLLLILLCLPMIGFGQGWEKTFDKTSGDHGNSVQQTSDGGYIICGTIGYSGNGNGASMSGDVYLIKTDSQGDTIWTKIFGNIDISTFPQSQFGNSVQQTSDGGYIICGIYHGPEVSCRSIYLIKTDANGIIQWNQTIGGATVASGCAEGFSVQETTDLGYIITGRIIFPGSDDDLYLVKTDSQGNTIWTNILGGVYSDCGYSVQQTSDGGYIIAGSVYKSIVNIYKDVYLIKTDNQGDTIWTKTFDGGIERDDEGYSVQQTSDGGYIICGSMTMATSIRMFLIKTNNLGNMMWTETFGNTSGEGRSVQQTIDGGYIIAGTIDNYLHLVKTNNMGIKQWDQTFLGPTASQAWGYSVQQTSDGGYIICGKQYSPGGSSWDIYLIKTDGNGNVTSTFNIPTPNSNRKLEKVVDILGKETKPQTNIPFIEIYDDGTVEKRIVIE